MNFRAGYRLSIFAIVRGKGKQSMASILEIQKSEYNGILDKYHQPGFKVRVKAVVHIGNHDKS